MKLFYPWMVFMTISPCHCAMNTIVQKYYITTEDKAVDDSLVVTKTFNTDSEIGCYMWCTKQNENCCLLEIKIDDDKQYKCSIYNHISSVLALNYNIGCKIAEKIACDSCKSLRAKGNTNDGGYEVMIDGETSKVYCDMTTDGGGWTVFQKRFDGSVDFQKTWKEYKDGFGDIKGEHWLGNDKIHQLTKNRADVILRIEGTDYNGVTKHITMRGFWVEDEASNYKLHGGIKVDGEDGMVNSWLFHNGMSFSAKDRDSAKQCSTYYGKGGFWFASCFRFNPNGMYSETNETSKQIMSWNKFGHLKKLKMLLK